MRIYVMRHGITPMNQEGLVNGEIDEPMAPEGIEQVEAKVGNLPSGLKIVYTSPLRRAKHTGEIISRAHALPMVVLNDLREISMGELAGKAWSDMPNGEELKRLHRSVQFDYTEYGGESKPQVTARLRGVILNIEQKHQDGEVLLVSHGGIVRTLGEMFGQPAIADTVGNASIVEFETTQLN